MICWFIWCSLKLLVSFLDVDIYLILFRMPYENNGSTLKGFSVELLTFICNEVGYVYRFHILFGKLHWILNRICMAMEGFRYL